MIPFPFDQPAPTAFYLTVYLLTFALHQAFMHYVLAGSLYVLWTTVFPGQGTIPRAQQPPATTLREWMPFLLSAAITAGVAPLLFIQVVYQYQFYTANLLLWWRWMMVVPVLIVAFYLLYLLKGRFFWKQNYAIQVIGATATSFCFLFVGFCWTANHLVANSGSDWPMIYASGRLPLVANLVIPRMLVWIGGSFGTMAVFLGWQLRYQQKKANDGAGGSAVCHLAMMSCGGLLVAAVAGVGYFVQWKQDARDLLVGREFQPYLWMTVMGLIGQLAGWSLQFRSGKFTVSGMALATAGCGLGLIAVSVLREGLRVNAVNLSTVAEHHAMAAQVGGFYVFLVATMIVTGIMIWCARLVQHDLAGKEQQ